MISLAITCYVQPSLYTKGLVVFSRLDVECRIIEPWCKYNCRRNQPTSHRPQQCRRDLSRRISHTSRERTPEGETIKYTSEETAQDGRPITKHSCTWLEKNSIEGNESVNVGE